MDAVSKHFESEPLTIALRTSAEILSRLDEALNRSPDGILASDADGTLWEGDVGIDLFESLLACKGTRDAAKDALCLEAAAFGVDTTGDAHAVAEKLYKAWQREEYPEDRAFAMMTWAFAGWSVDEVSAFAGRVLDSKQLSKRLRHALRPIVDWANDHNVDVLVVSASPRGIVEQAVEFYGIPAAHVIAMTPLVLDGQVLAKLAGEPIYGEGKVNAIRKLRSGAPILGALGDSLYDAPMLRAARVPIAVNPSNKLLAVASTIPNLVILAT